IKVTLSPFDTPNTSRTSFGIVIWPFAITLALSTNAFAAIILHHLFKNIKVGISLLFIIRKIGRKINGGTGMNLKKMLKKLSMLLYMQLLCSTITMNIFYICYFLMHAFFTI